MEFFEHSVFFGVSLSLLAYGLGVVLQKRFRLALFNPLLLSVIVTILVLVTAHIDYEVYYAGAKYLSYLLTPATVCLAVPLYEQFLQECRSRGFAPQHGRFGADMLVASENDGPVTILLDTDELLQPRRG